MTSRRDCSTNNISPLSISLIVDPETMNGIEVRGKKKRNATPANCLDECGMLRSVVSAAV